MAVKENSNNQPDATNESRPAPVHICGPRAVITLQPSTSGDSWQVQDPRAYEELEDDSTRSLATRPRPAIISVAGAISRPDAAEYRTSVCQIPVEPGLTVILGAAGTGKTSTLALIRATLEEQHVHCLDLHLNEADYEDDLGTEAWLPALHTAMADAAAQGSAAVLIDSLRHFATISTGYKARLGNSGFDLTTLQALSDLDRAARRLSVRLVATLFLSTYQLTKGDLADDQKMARLLATIAHDVDGCATTTILLGPTRRTPGQYTATTRVNRQLTLTGTFPHADATLQVTDIIAEPKLARYMMVSATGRSDAVIYAAQLASSRPVAGRVPSSAIKKRPTTATPLDISDLAAAADAEQRLALPLQSVASSILSIPDLEQDDFED